MAETITLGIVGIKNCGNYNSDTTYEKLNVVTYQGSTYCALKETKGNLPTNTTYWQLYASKGDIGPVGPVGPIGPVGPAGQPSGAPLVASSTSGMTDTSKVYVNTSDGKWYYYNGTAWQAGGVYQASENSNDVDNLLNMIKQLENPASLSEEERGYILDGNGAVSAYATVQNRYNPNYFKVPTGYRLITIMEAPENYDLSTDSLWNAIAIYDANKTFIKRYVSTNLTGSSAGTYRETFTDYQGKKYLVSNYNLNSNSNTPVYFRYMYVSNDGEVKFRFIDAIDSYKNNYLEYTKSKEDFKYYTQDVVELNNINVEWELGAIDGTHGTDYDSNKRIRSAFIPVNKNTLIRFKGLFHNYSWGAHWYDENKNHISSTDWTFNNFISSINGFVRLAIRKNSETEIDSSEIDSISSLVFVKYTQNADDMIRTKELIDTLIEDVSLINNLSDNVALAYSPIRSVAHRGYEYAYPENTLIAFKMAKKYGFDFVETDIRYTSDGVAVLLHDPSINRTARNADGTELSGTVNISDITYAEALQYDFGIYKGNQFAGTKIPTFEEFVSLCRSLNIGMAIELKVDNTEKNSELVETIKDYGLFENEKVYWMSWHTPLVNLHSIYPNLNFVFITTTINSLSSSLQVKNNNNHVVILGTSVEAGTLELMKNNNIELGIWGLSTEQQILDVNKYCTFVVDGRFVAKKVFYDSSLS